FRARSSPHGNAPISRRRPPAGAAGSWQSLLLATLPAGDREPRRLFLAREGARTRGRAARPAPAQAVLISIFFSFFCASGFFGSVTFSTPFSNRASILSASTPSGASK